MDPAAALAFLQQKRQKVVQDDAAHLQLYNMGLGVQVDADDEGYLEYKALISGGIETPEKVKKNSSVGSDNEDDEKDQEGFAFEEIGKLDPTILAERLLLTAGTDDGEPLEKGRAALELWNATGQVLNERVHELEIREAKKKKRGMGGGKKNKKAGFAPGDDKDEEESLWTPKKPKLKHQLKHERPENAAPLTHLNALQQYVGNFKLGDAKFRVLDQPSATRLPGRSYGKLWRVQVLLAIKK